MGRFRGVKRVLPTQHGTTQHEKTQHGHVLGMGTARSKRARAQKLCGTARTRHGSWPGTARERHDSWLGLARHGTTQT